MSDDSVHDERAIAREALTAAMNHLPRSPKAAIAALLSGFDWGGDYAVIHQALVAVAAELPDGGDRACLEHARDCLKDILKDYAGDKLGQGE